MVFLLIFSDIIQEVAAKGLVFLYECGDENMKVDHSAHNSFFPEKSGR